MFSAKLLLKIPCHFLAPIFSFNYICLNNLRQIVKLEADLVVLQVTILEPDNTVFFCCCCCCVLVMLLYTSLLSEL